MSPRARPAWLPVLAVLAARPLVAHADAPRPVVLVVDAGRARVGVDGLRREVARALARDLGRDVVRLVDAAADASEGTLTLAHDVGFRWVVRYEPRGAEARVAVRTARSATLDAVLADAAVSLVSASSSAAGPASSAEAPASSAEAPADARAPWDAALRAAAIQELIDPFATPAPRAGVRLAGIAADVIDPFAGTAEGAFVRSEVLDPWRR